jgi:hypothetical protein
MPNGNKRGSRRRNRSGRNNRAGGSTIQGTGPNGNQIVNFHGSCVIEPSLLTTPTIIELTPVSTSPFGSRLSSMANVFELCRCVGLTITFITPFQSGTHTGSSDPVSAVVAYDPFIEATSASTFSQVAEFGRTAHSFSGMSVPSKLTLNRKTLIGMNPLKWFPTTASSGEAELVYQGGIFFAASATPGNNDLYLIMRIDYRYEFCGPVALGRALKNRVSQPSFLRRDKIVVDQDDEKKVIDSPPSYQLVDDDFPPLVSKPAISAPSVTSSSSSLFRSSKMK